MSKLYEIIKCINVHEAKTGKRISKVSLTQSLYDEISAVTNNEMEMFENNFKETGYYGKFNGIPFEVDDDQKEEFVIVD